MLNLTPEQAVDVAQNLDFMFGDVNVNYAPAGGGARCLAFYVGDDMNVTEHEIVFEIATQLASDESAESFRAIIRQIELKVWNGWDNQKTVYLPNVTVASVRKSAV